MSEASNGAVRVRLKKRDGWSITRMMPESEVGGFETSPQILAIPFREGQSVTEWGGFTPSVSRHFRVVKTAKIIDHRTNETRLEKWFEEV